MDGINGLAGIEGLIASATLAVLLAMHNDALGAIASAGLAGGCAGFLPWNFPTARTFMGDSGSTFLGFLLGILVLRSQSFGIGILVAALPLTPFVFDTVATLAIRVARRERFWIAHRMHFYQRLLSAGWSHSEVTALWSVLALASAATALAYEGLDPVEGAVAVGGVVVLHIAVGAAVLAVQRRALSSTPTRSA
jgi:Fuc2NAc and GlcNAc transferase